MILIDGKAISEQVKQEIAAEVAEIVAQGGKRPHLAAILVGLSIVPNSPLRLISVSIVSPTTGVF